MRKPDFMGALVSLVEVEEAAWNLHPTRLSAVPMRSFKRFLT